MATAVCGNHDVIFICPLSVCAIDCTEQTLPHCMVSDIASTHIDQAIISCIVYNPLASDL